MDSEAIKDLLTNVTPGPWEADGPNWNQIIWSSDGNRVCFMAHSNGLDVARDTATARFIAAARELVPALLAERDAALAEVARLSTPPDDAEVAALVKRLSGTPLYEGHGEASDAPDEAADALTRLSHAIADETAKREAMEVLHEAAKALHRDMLERAQLKIDAISGEQYRIVNSGRTAWADFDAALAALVKHGSKT